MSPSPVPSPRLRSLLAAPPAFALFGLLALCFCCDSVLLGPYALVRLRDGIASAVFLDLPEQGRILIEHGLSAWFPKGAGGAPALSLPHAPASPLPLAAALVPLGLVHALLARVGPVALAGYGLFRLLSVRFRVRTPLALLSGVLFALDAARHGASYAGAAFFPLFFVLTSELFEPGRSRLGRLLRALGLAALCLLIPPDAALPLLPLLHAALLLMPPREAAGIRRLPGVLAVWLGFVLIRAPEICGLAGLPPADPLAKRAGSEILAGLAAALGAGLRDQPVLALFLCCLPALWPTRQGRAAVLLAALSLALPVAASAAGPALTRGLDPAHWAAPAPLCLALACGLGLEEFCGRPRLPHLLVPVCAVAATRLFSSEEEVLRNGLFLGLGLAGLDLARRRARGFVTEFAAGVVLFAFCLAGAGMFVKRSDLLENHAPYAKAFGRHKGLRTLAREDREGPPFRVACLDLHPAVAAVRGLDCVDRPDRPVDTHYRDYLAAVLAVQLRGNPEAARRFASERLGLSLFSPDREPGGIVAFQSGRRRAAEWDMPLLAAMNVKYLVAARPVRDIEDYADLVFREDEPRHFFRFLKSEAVDAFYSLPLFVYRLREPLERGFFAREAVVLPGRGQPLEEMARLEIEGLRRTVFFWAGDLPAGLTLPPAGPSAAPGTDRVRLAERGPDQLVFEGEAAGPGFLVVSNRFDPRWSARLDNEPAAILRANAAFQAVPVGRSGPFRIELVFRDPALVPAAFCSLAGLALLFGLAAPARGSPACPAGPEPAATGREPLRIRLRHLLLGAGVVVGLWLSIYILFTILPDDPARDRPILYTLLVTPPTGLLLALWGGLALRRW